MMRAVTTVTMTLLVVGAFLAATVPAAANRFTETADQLRIDCTDWTSPGDDFFLEGTGEIDWEADTDFWVRHGWITFPWTVPYDPDEDETLSPAERRAFMSPVTEYVLLVDGEVVKSRLYAAHVATWSGFVGTFEDVKVKVFISEFRGGMSGTVEFTGMWFYDSSDPFFGGEFRDPFPWARCDLTVNFV